MNKVCILSFGCVHVQQFIVCEADLEVLMLLVSCVAMLTIDDNRVM